MTHRKLTASGLALAAACPAAYALPAVEDLETDAMRAGTGRHAFLDALAGSLFGLEATPAAARDGALSLIPSGASWRSTCEAIDVEQLLDVTGSRGGRVEVGTAFTWWPATDIAEETHAREHRAYRDDPTAIHGTADWIVTAPSGDVTVVDFKGSLRGAPAADHPQVAFYGLALARARGLDAVTVALVYLDEDGSLTRDDATHDAWALDAWAARLADVHCRVAVARAAASPGDHARVGDHCASCPALRVCPAQVALARELVASPPSPETYPALTDEDAGAAWQRVALFEELLARAKEALRVRALRKGLPLPDGRWLMPVESTRRTVDVERALPVLRSLVGDRAEGLVERSLSASAVDSLARELAAAGGEKVKAVTERVWAELREAKAAKESTYVQLRPKKLAGGGA